MVPWRRVVRCIERARRRGNSADNPFNPDPKASVRFGDQTWDEMMVGFIDIAITPDMDLAKLIKMPARPTGAQ